MTLLVQNSAPISLQNALRQPVRKINRRASMGTEMSSSTKQSQSRRRRLEQPITFRELLSRHSTSAAIARQKQSCLKDPRAPQSTQKKQVRFATNMLNRKVWCHVKEVEKIPEEKHPKLWFSEEEFQQTVQDAVSEAIVEKSDEDEYVDSFNSLFKTLKKGKQRGIPEQEMKRVMQNVTKCAGARGLEMHIVAKARDYAQKHRESVLEAQDILRQNGLQKCKKGRALISKESAKYSGPSQVVANELARYDFVEAAKARKSPWRKANRRRTIA